MKGEIIMQKAILIVEDEIRIRFLLRDYFLKDDFIIYEAENGLEALNLYKEKKIDLIILDIMMPSYGWTNCFRKD